MKYTIDKLKSKYKSSIFNADDFIFFWGHHEKVGEITKACFSQWYPSPFTVDSVTYNCAEQYMMSEKARVFGDEETRKKILIATEPSIIKQLGREVKNFNDEKWKAEAFGIVVKGNIAKFSQNEQLKAFLISTKNKILVEASPYDRIWGIGMKKEEAEKTNPCQWKGTNFLGFALMETRDYLK